MSAPTLAEQVAMVTDTFEAGWIDRATAMDVLIEASGMSPGLCAALLADEITDRRYEARLRDLAAERGPDEWREL